MSNFKTILSTVEFFRNFEQKTAKNQRFMELKNVLDTKVLENGDFKTYDELRKLVLE